METMSWSPLICAERAPSRETGYMELREKVFFNISGLFIVDTTSVLKLMFLITYCFCLDSHLSGCVVVIINIVIAFFLLL